MFHRNTRDQFKYDHIALRVCKKAIKDPVEFSKYRLIEKLFIVFPLMHSESIEDSNLLVDYITEFIQYSKQRDYKECSDTLSSFLKAANTFTQILVCYGRFPHRN